MSRPVIRVGPQLEARGAIPPRFVSYCRAATTVIAATLGFGALLLTFVAILTLNGMRPALGASQVPPRPEIAQTVHAPVSRGAEYR